MKRLILAGGGHAHLSVLERFAREKPRAVEAILVTPSRWQIYSGMLPGWMSGHYSRQQCEIDLHPLARAARMELAMDSIVDMDADRRFVTLTSGRRIDYDLLSLDVGSETETSMLAATGVRLLPVKPLDRFFDAWPRIVGAARERRDYRLVVVGGGAAGVELSLAARFALNGEGVGNRVDIVVSESGFLAGHARGVKRRVSRYLDHAGVRVHSLQATGVDAGVSLSDGTTLQADCVIAATGARAPAWLARSRLKLDDGYVAVDEFNRSQSHPEVFAGGDVSARQDVAVGRSGVHAVHVGPVLAANLLAAIGGGRMQSYRPRRHSLYLLACGPRYAIASWGPWGAEGRWVWRWKDRIDRNFTLRFGRQDA